MVRRAADSATAVPAAGPTDEQEFDFSGGELCLDFANTLSDRTTDSPKDHLSRYADVVSWSRQAGLVTPSEAERLETEAKRRPKQSAQVLKRAVTLREALYSIFSAVARGRSPDDEAMATLNAALAKPMGFARIVQRKDGFEWDWSDEPQALDCMLWPVLRSASELLTSDDLHAVRECNAEDCAWLFMDESRNRSRRWCSMAGCGNRAKARRYYARTRARDAG